MQTLKHFLYYIFCYALIISRVTPAFAQDSDLSVVAGAGWFTGGEVQRGGVAAIGGSFGFPSDSKHRLQLDYISTSLLSGSQERETVFFLTGSYVIQSNKKRTRPFFQIGIGMVRLKEKGWTLSGPYGTIVVPEERKNGLAIIFGTGATVDISESLFIKPQIRFYGHIGPAITILPCVGLGLRF